MHSNIIFLTDEKGRKSDFDINELECCIDQSDIGMESVADYLDGSVEVPEYIGNIPVEPKDHSIELTKSNIEEYFSKRYKKYVENYSKMTLSDFCSVDEYDVHQTIERAYSVYIVPVYENGTYENAETLDSFLRKVYRFAFDDCPKKTYYILGCIGYHW